MFRIRMRELREAAGYKSQQAFADVFGVAQSTVGNWEAGKREPNYETMIRLSHFFHVSVDYLLGCENEVQPPKEKPVALMDNELSPQQQEVLRLFDVADPIRQQIALDILKAAEAADKAKDTL